MAARVLLFGILCTFGLIGGKTIGSELGVKLGVEPPPEAVASRGRGFALHCGPPANNGTTISWQKDGKPITSDSRIWVTNNGSLVFSKVVHKKKGLSDAGEYRCLAKNVNGTLLSRPSRLIIPSISHEFTVHPESRNSSEGDVTRFACSIESSPPATITWLKDSQPLPQTKRFTAFDSGILYINNIKQEDAGSYSCEARNAHIKKTPRSEEGLLIVREGGLPKALHFLPDSPPDNVTVKAGKFISIPCAVSGIPKPTTAWSHTRLDGSNATIQTSNNGLNILRINKATHSQHSGIYICTAHQLTKEKSLTLSKKVLVIVETPPVIVEKPKTQIYPAAKTVRIDCDVKGNPQIPAVWYKDGVRLFINGRIKQNLKQLVLSSAVSQDTGIYQCFVGDVWAAGRLVVNTSSDQPMPPTNLTCNPLSPTQIQLSWSTLQHGVKAYSVHYFPTDGGEESKDVAPNDTFTVNKLQPYTNYTFYVRSYGRSASEQSRRVICSTGETVPSGGPQVNVTVTGSHCLLVSWTPPPLTKARGAITNYKVQWKRVNQSSFNFEILPSHINKYRISGLVNGEKYMVRVMGATALGWPEFSDFQHWVNATLPLSTSVLQSPIFTITPFNSTAIRADWSYSGATSNIDGYILTYKKVGSDIGGNVTLSANTTFYLISKLESGNWYDISMKVFFGDQYGEECSETFLVGDDSSLPPPTLMEAAPISPSSIRVSWRPPPHSVVSKYTVEITSGGKTVRAILVNQTTVEVSNLSGNTVYEVQVKAHGLHNESSSYSFKLECRTPAYVLEPVEDVSWKAVNSTSALVTWSPLRVPVHGYDVLFTREVDAPIDLWHSRSVLANQTSVLLTGLKSTAKYMITVRGIGSNGPGPLSPKVDLKLGGEELPPETHRPHTSKNSDQTLGILVGCGISVLFILICSGSLIFRKRCWKSSAQPSQHEMTALTDIHSKIGVRNGQVNGLKLFPNGRVPNGHTVLRITENPQCQAGGSGREEREGESLLNETQTTTIDLSHDAG